MKTNGFAKLAALVVFAMSMLGIAIAPMRGLAAERNFYDVVEDVVGDFEFDLKTGNVAGLKDLSIRNVVVSENVPPSFRGHIEFLITERILKTTKAKVVQCAPCRGQKTTLEGDQVTVSSPQTDPVELARIAKKAGIEHFLDIAFSYQPNGILMSMYISEPEGGSIIWSKSYNSETSRAAAFRRGVDYSQVDDVQKTTEYTPTIQYRGTVLYAFEPNVSGTTGCIGVAFRMVERYDNRKKEVGFELDYFKDSTTLGGTSTTSAATANLYSGINLTMLFVHAWNMIGGEENFNKVRGSFNLSIGGTYASGFLGGILRAGYEWRLGKHFAVSTMLGYRPSATAFIGATGTTVSGPEFGLGISLLF